MNTTCLSYDDIYQKCLEAISQYAESVKSDCSPTNQKVCFVADSHFKEIYKLYLCDKFFKFRTKGSFNTHSIHKAQELIQKVVFLAEEHGLGDRDVEHINDKKKSCCDKKKRKLKEMNDSPGSPQKLEKVINLKKRKCAVGPELAREKRQNNLQKAFEEHHTNWSINRIFQSSTLVPLSFRYSMAEGQGPKPFMEDAGFCLITESDVLAGVFDGHCDEGKISTYTSDYFKEHFLNKLKASTTPITSLFENFLDRIHKDLEASWGGTTAVVCYIDKLTNLMYVSTLGDSQSIVFRKKGDEILWFPVSCVRDWSCKVDARRAVEGLKLYKLMYPNETLKDPKLEFIDYEKYLDINSWIEAEFSKSLRFPPNRKGINVSRTVGDYNNINRWPNIEILSHKPKVTEFLLGSDDCIVIGSDGIWDYIKMEELIENILKPHWGSEDMSQLIVDYALKTCNGRDNATAICLHTQPN